MSYSRSLPVLEILISMRSLKWVVKAKVLLVSVVLIGVMHDAHGQLRKGSFLIGGTLSASYASPEMPNAVGTARKYSVNLSPAVSYFLMDNLALGIITPWDYVHQKMKGYDNHSGSSAYAIGPTVRYYFPFGKWAVFPVLSYTHGWSTERSLYTPDPHSSVLVTKALSNTFTGGVGVTYFVTKNVGVEGILSYVHNKLDWPGPPHTINHDWSREKQLNLSVGLQVYLFKP